LLASFIHEAGQATWMMMTLAPGQIPGMLKQVMA
jgi:hypothetical protein